MNVPPTPEQALQAEDLFYRDNLDLDQMTPLRWILLALWTPIGLPLMAVRAALAIGASLVVPPRYRAWWVTFLTGIFLVVRNKTKIRDHGVVVVSNHISYLDGMTVRAAVRSTKPLATLLWHKVNRLNKIMARPSIPVMESGKNRQLTEKIKTYLRKGNVLLFPEATVTDGSGLLRFERMAFSLDARVVLVAIRHRRPLPFIHPSALREKLIIQVFFELFQPWIVAEIECLGVHTPGPDESFEDFAKRSQQLIADALGVPTTSYTWRDRRRLMVELKRTKERT
ncbi:MAG: hypothetical protein EA397_01175 [Deltaproteobacteria bacterium]|nr:MAG: hypothetical protein EA397_01175 [Deltaproteobacteria bacterium]